MSVNNTRRQAAQLESLLTKVMRRLFTLESGHPVSELPLAQLRVCSILQTGPRAMSAVGEELGISLSAVTQLTDRMVRGGLVERMTEADDRRVKLLVLTDYGQEMMRSRKELRTRRAEQALKRLSPEERDELLQVLGTLLEASQASSPDVPFEDPSGIRVMQ